jgi:uncharacterized protein (TIGR00725 family)
MKRMVAVIGGRSTEKALLREAETIGKLLAQRNAVVVCGGLGGVMVAVSRGARSEGGLTVGVLPQNDTREANQFIDIPVVTGMGIGRNVIIARTADALIAVGGEYGTLSEIAFALQLGKPVVGIQTWDIKGVVSVDNGQEAVDTIFSIIESEKNF